MDRSLAELLKDAVGPGAVSASTVGPTSQQGVATACRILAEAGARFAVVGTLPPTNGASRNGTVLLSLHRLAAVEVQPQNLVARAEAGATLVALRTGVEAEGMQLAAAVAAGTPSGTTVGSLVARGRVARRALTGIEAVLPSGEIVRSGGPVLKDVAGYDLAAVLLGSAGRLAVVTAAWFRLQPESTRVETFEPGLTALEGPVSGLVRSAFDPHGLLVAR